MHPTDSGITPAQALSNAQNPQTPIKDLYTLSLQRVTLFKSGAAFSEHSPLLHSLSQLPSFQKPLSGLQKMFLGEVVGKRVVVQGLWVGGWCWGENMPDVGRGKGGAVKDTGQGTRAPWASDGRGAVLEAARGDWTAAATPARR